MICIRYQGQPVRAPASPDLPGFRVDHSAFAFQFTELDYAGPLLVKDGLKNNKSYIFLLTCASSHAIHLDLVLDMSIDGFWRDLKRFMARRGVPDLVISDNFKTLNHLKKRNLCCYEALSNGSYCQRPHGEWIL